MLSIRDPPQTKGQIETESEGLGKYISGRDQKKVGVAILISDKMDLKKKTKLKTQRQAHLSEAPFSLAS